MVATRKSESLKIVPASVRICVDRDEKCSNVVFSPVCDGGQDEFIARLLWRFAPAKQCQDFLFRDHVGQTVGAEKDLVAWLQLEFMRFRFDAIARSKCLA